MASEITQSPLNNDAARPQADMKERFYRYFQEEEQMSRLENHSAFGGERQDAIDYCLAGIARLSNEAIKALSEKLQETRAKIAPKARFQFKSNNKNSSAISLNDAAELAAEKRIKSALSKTFASNESSIATTPAFPMTPQSEKDALGDLPSLSKNYNDEITKSPEGPVRKPSFSQASNINISGHTGLHIILPSTASRATSFGSVTKLDRCVVDMSVPTASSGAPFAGLALKNIKNSVIIAGNVAGAAHITDIKDSVLVVASRQVRMHECQNVDIYLHCASRPIIEDCSNVRFAPLPACYASILDNPTENHWDQVDDFKWLKAEHSPNWSILPEGERLGEEVFTDVVPGGPGVGVDDILKKIDI
ncbi:tubulin-specific chaperone-like protein c [Xylogone sp. PMI_703]|nr:tubulin-specific chaperone-like protein c [Xylogone sp. PMI_703]